MRHKERKAPRCDRKAVEAFDYTKLDATFAKLAKPAQRALINNGICTPHDLAAWTLTDVMKLHGIGPSALPVLQTTLAAKGLAFKT